MSNNPKESLNYEATLVGQPVPDYEATIVGNESPSQEFARSTNGNLNETPTHTVISLVNKFLAKAVEKKATRVEIEPEANFLSIRYGERELLKPLIEPLPKKFAAAILSQLKLMAELDINQTQTPQKGRIRKRGGGRTIHFFVQTQPSVYGEKMRIRVVDSAVKPPELETLISDALIRQSLEEMVKGSSGVLLVTSTQKEVPKPLLYSLFSQDISNPKDMVSVEASINYLLSGMSQVEIDVDREKDYPQVLQSLLEQDKSRIMVDRISDPSVARMVAEMANNDRFVLTSLSAEDGISAIALLGEMITPGLLADTLIGVIHEHSLPRLCPACRTVHEPSMSALTQWGIIQDNKEPHTFYQPRSLNEMEREQMREKGRLCRQCNGNGYDGQVKLYELYTVTPSLQTAIASGADLEELKQVILEEQRTSLREKALSLLEQGDISFTEFTQLCPKNPVYAVPSETLTPLPTDVTQRLEQIETLLVSLTQEFHQLKQTLKPPVSSPTPRKIDSYLEKLPQTPSFEDATKVTQINQHLAPDIDFGKETIAADSNLYEELQDPGDWEALKQELDPNKETIVTTNFSSQEDRNNNPFKSIPDPWS